MPDPREDPRMPAWLAGVLADLARNGDVQLDLMEEGRGSQGERRVAEAVLALAAATPWAMTEPALRQLLAIAQRVNDRPEVVEAHLGRPLQNTETVTVRDGVATVPVTGPLFRYANLFTRISGATSYQVLGTELGRAIEDPQVRAILLNIDSPGGEVNGVADLGALLYAARGAKPIVAYVGGLGASGGYWIASAAERVLAAPTAILGSIGVRMSASRPAPGRDAARGIETFEFVSSQSPKKNADPGTDAGRTQIQTMVDQLAQVFIDTVAQHRGVSAATVARDFGQGDVFVGQAAVDAGLADGISTFEQVHAALVEEIRATTRMPSRAFQLPGRAPGARTSAPSPAASDASSDRAAASVPPLASEEHMPTTQEQSPAASGQPAATAGTAGATGTTTPPAPAPATAPANVPSADQIAAARTEGASAERARIQGILALSRPGAEEIIAAHVADGTRTRGDAAEAILAAGIGAPPAPGRSAGGAQHLAALRGDEATGGTPAASTTGATAGADSPEAAAAKILADFRKANPGAARATTRS